MSELRSKMKTEMELRGFSKNSISRYAYVVSEFSKFYKKSPDLLGEKEIRKFFIDNGMLKIYQELNDARNFQLFCPQRKLMIFLMLQKISSIKLFL